MFALIFAVGTAHGCSSVLPQSIQADVVDVDERATGERKEGVYFAASGMVMKAAAGFSVMLVGVALDMVGFRPNVE